MINIFLDSLPRYRKGTYKGKINWADSIGTNVKFEYIDDEKEDITFCGNLIIKGYNCNTRKLTIDYNGIISEIRACRLQDGNIKKLIGANLNTTTGRFADFKIEIGDQIIDENRNFTILNRKRVNTQKYQYRKMYNYQCNICGFDSGWMEECDLLHHKSGCPCCSNYVVVKGVNDIPTTDPWMIPYFQGGYKEAVNYSSGSNKKIYPICPICGKIKNIKISICQIKERRSIGCTCRDGISYPEKFFISFLEQMHIKFIYQLSKSNFEWIEKYCYDFYLPDYNCIVETHGEQHYKDTTWSSSTATNGNDIRKMNLAMNNGIKHYIQLDCRKSTMKFISDSILNSELKNLLKIEENKINWKQCSEFACGNITKDICDFYVNNNHNISIVSEHFQLSKSCIGRYLRLGNELGWCMFPYHTYRRVLVFSKNEYLGIFPSAKYIESISMNNFNTYLGQTQIIRNCNKNKYSNVKTYKDFYFIFEPDYLKNYKTVS